MALLRKTNNRWKRVSKSNKLASKTVKSINTHITGFGDILSIPTVLINHKLDITYDVLWEWGQQTFFNSRVFKSIVFFSKNRICFMQGWIATARNRFTRKRNTKILKDIGNLFKKEPTVNSRLLILELIKPFRS